MLVRILYFAALAVILASGIVGCSHDDDPAGPEQGFALTVVVTSAAGEPVAGLRGALSPDLDNVLWPYDKARDLPPGVEIESLRILDVAGTLVCTLITPEDEPPYNHVWNGCDDGGETVHDGVYRYVLKFYDEDENLEVRDEQIVLITGDPDQHAAGVTDAAGRFEVDDATYVPAFFDIEPLEILDEDGNVIATETITTRTRLTLLAGTGAHLVVIFDAQPEPQTLTVTWDPE